MCRTAMAFVRLLRRLTGVALVYGSALPLERMDRSMPDCFTHTHIATQALMLSGQTVASRQAYYAGANGPDPLFMYKFWSKKREQNLPLLAEKMHTEKTGEFLKALMLYAVTPAQQSYVLGYLTHYCVDCTMNPYVSAMCAETGPYHGESGRAKMETQMDSTLYFNEYKTYLVPLSAGTPILVAEDLAQVTALLHDALLDVYGWDVPKVELADTYHDNQSMRKFMISRFGIKKVFAGIIGSLFAGDKKAGRMLKYRMQPAGPVDALPANWTNPFTGQQMDLTMDEVVELAAQTSAACIGGCMQFWLGELDETSITEIMGSNNYYTGLHIPQDGGEQQPEQAAVPEETAGA